MSRTGDKRNKGEESKEDQSFLNFGQLFEQYSDSSDASSKSKSMKEDKDGLIRLLSDFKGALSRFEDSDLAREVHERLEEITKEVNENVRLSRYLIGGTMLLAASVAGFSLYRLLLAGIARPSDVPLTFFTQRKPFRVELRGVREDGTLLVYHQKPFYRALRTVGITGRSFRREELLPVRMFGLKGTALSHAFVSDRFLGKDGFVTPLSIEPDEEMARVDPKAQVLVASVFMKKKAFDQALEADRLREEALRLEEKKRSLEQMKRWQRSRVPSELLEWREKVSKMLIVRFLGGVIKFFGFFFRTKPLFSFSFSFFKPDPAIDLGVGLVREGAYELKEEERPPVHATRNLEDIRANDKLVVDLEEAEEEARKNRKGVWEEPPVEYGKVIREWGVKGSERVKQSLEGWSAPALPKKEDALSSMKKWTKYWQERGADSEGGNSSDKEGGSSTK